MRGICVPIGRWAALIVVAARLPDARGRLRLPQEIVKP